MRNRIGIFFFLTTALNAFADVEVSEEIIYYRIAPKATHDISTQLKIHSPVRKNGETFFAQTQSTIAWKFWIKSTQHNCWIDKVNVEVQVNYTLPELRDASVAIQQVWDNWFPSVLQHEYGHKDNAVEYAQKIYQQIESLPVHLKCASLKLAANEIGNELTAQLRETDRLYDQDTEHGKTQGAWLGKEF